jgi:hypothetical protein
VQVRLEVGKSHPLPYRRAVANDVQIIAPEVYYSLTMRILDPSVTYIPFIWDDPVEYRGTGRHFYGRKWNVLAQGVEGAAYTVARKAPADGKQLGGERMDVTPDAGAFI